MKLISLNIEGNKHWERVLPYIEKEKPDVLCVQEIFADDITRITDAFQMDSTYIPMHLECEMKENVGSCKDIGVAIFSKYPFKNIQHHTYYSPAPHLKQLMINDENPQSIREINRQVLAVADIHIENHVFTVGTTHFTWTPDGKPSTDQYTDADSLLATLSDIPSIILCGDFNVPRGHNDIYEKFVERYSDAIPHSYTCSFDQNLHRVGNIPERWANVGKYMVDYFFLSPHYRAENVRLQSGISDHYAVVGEISIRM